jgi:peroxiredoxin
MAFQAPPAPKTHLKKGDSAPDFKLRATNGATVTLGEHRGKNTVVLAFFPAAFTGG